MGRCRSDGRRLPIAGYNDIREGDIITKPSRKSNQRKLPPDKVNNARPDPCTRCRGAVILYFSAMLRAHVNIVLQQQRESRDGGAQPGAIERDLKVEVKRSAPVTSEPWGYESASAYVNMGICFDTRLDGATHSCAAFSDRALHIAGLPTAMPMEAMPTV